MLSNKYDLTKNRKNIEISNKIFYFEIWDIKIELTREEKKKDFL